ncbi:MAG: hypothetical protein ING41_12580 [Burkholderiales bacterium]|jgi:hypothetical protein|nr:hypothetical protein [Burkholderiales bacterium]
MRKISPNDVKSDFIDQLAALEGFYHTGFGKFSTDRDRSTLTEQSLLAAAVLWEGFVSEMFIAYINRDAARFKAHLHASFAEHVALAPKQQRTFETFGALTFPEHLTKSDVQTLADGIGNNITFPNFAELEQRAKTWLVPNHANKFRSLSAQQKAVINAVIALRNHIAHRSPRSLDAMNEVLAAGALHATGIRRTANRFHNVGAWLKAVPVGRQESRFVTIVRVLNDVGAAF